MVTTLVENYNFLYTCLLTFLLIIIMIGEPTYIASEMVPRAPAISIIV